MLQRLRDFFSTQPPPRLPAVPDGRRYFAIGDIHGRLDLYEAMIGAIEAEIAAAPGVDHRIIVLGDLVDRGPDSAGIAIYGGAKDGLGKITIQSATPETIAASPSAGAGGGVSGCGL